MKKKEEKKMIIYNRIGLDKEKQELSLFNVNRCVFTFDIKNDVAKWILPIALYDPNYRGETKTHHEMWNDLPVASKKEPVCYDEIKLGSGGIYFLFKGQIVQNVALWHLFTLANKFAKLNVEFKEGYVNEDDKWTTPIAIEGFEFINEQGGLSTICFDDWRMSRDNNFLTLFSGGEPVDHISIRKLIERYSKRYKHVGKVDSWI